MTFSLQREIRIVQINEGGWNWRNPLSVNNWVSHEVRKTIIDLNEDPILIADSFTAQSPTTKFVKIGLCDHVFVVSKMRGFPN